MEQDELNLFEMSFNDNIRAQLLETTRWTKFLSIVGFVVVGIFVIIALYVMTLGSASGLFDSMGAAGAVGMGLIYLVLAALYVYPIIALFKFSSLMKQGLNTNNTDLVGEAFRYQKSMFKFMGIFMIIILSFYAIVLLFVGGAALMKR